MSDEYKEKLGIPKNHTLEIVSSTWKGAKHGRDSDEIICKELDEQGNVVATYDVIDSTSIYPPFDRSIAYTKR